MIYDSTTNEQAEKKNRRKRRRVHGAGGGPLVGRPVRDVAAGLFMYFFFQYNYSGFISVLCFFNIMYLFFSI